METNTVYQTKVKAITLTFIIHSFLFLLFFVSIFKISKQSVTNNVFEKSEELEDVYIDMGSDEIIFSQISTANNSKKNEVAPALLTNNKEESVVIKTSVKYMDSIFFNTKNIENAKLSNELQNALNKAKNIKGKENKHNQSQNDGYDDSPDIPEIYSSLPIGPNMVGRKLIHKPLLINDNTEEGIVVVKIIINQSGDVIKAIGGERGSTTTNSDLIYKATAAAYQAKFSSNPEGIKEQIGTYTFVFTLE